MKECLRLYDKDLRLDEPTRFVSIDIMIMSCRYWRHREVFLRHAGMLLCSILQSKSPTAGLTLRVLELGRSQGRYVPELRRMVNCSEVKRVQMPMVAISGDCCICCVRVHEIAVEPAGANYNELKADRHDWNHL
jgi:hypothetical protein